MASFHQNRKSKSDVVHLQADIERGCLDVGDGRAMFDPIPLSQFVLLGERLKHLETDRVDVIAEGIPAFNESLDKCGFKATLALSRPLEGKQLLYGVKRRRITSSTAIELSGYLAPVRQSLYSEAEKQHVVPLIRVAVSRQLRDLPTRLVLNDTQTELLNETIRCLEIGAWRAGIVVVWAFAYDFVRQWVYDNHLASFNSALKVNHTRGGRPQYGEILDYVDFFSGPGERVVIDACEKGGIIVGKPSMKLREYLRRRNEFAHATSTAPSQEQANAYAKDLIDVITAKPFA